jgi:hypothetical protein
MYWEFIKKIFTHLFYIVMIGICAYVTSFVLWLYSKLTGRYYNTFSFWDQIFVQSGYYFPEWFEMYIVTFNIPYLLYIIVCCWGELTHVIYLSFKCVVYFDENHFNYLYQQMLFKARWKDVQYYDTWFFYRDIVWKLNRALFNNEAYIIDNFKYICPVVAFKHISLRNIIILPDNLDTLMVYGAVLFLLSTIISLFML